VTTISFTPLREPLTRDESRGLVGRTMGLVALTAAAFAGGAYLGRDTGGDWAILFCLASFATLIAIQAAVQRSEQVAIGLLLLFGLLLGLGSASTIAYYAQSEPQPLWEAGLATALFIAGFGAAGYATKLDLSALSRTLLWAALVYAIAGLVVFAGLTALDFQRLRRIEDIRSAPLLAASIFLDVLNVFWLFLPLFSNDDR
jgi:FtsH-binding integral membrane protein